MLVAMRAHFLLFFAFLAAPMLTASPIPRVLQLDRAGDQRPLLVFAPTASDPGFERQCALLDVAPLAQRDVVVALIPLHGSAPVCAHLNATVAAQLVDPAAARRRFHIPPDSFTVLLIGKDGGEKLRSHTPLTAQTLVETIDSMPMRQQEMKERRTEPKSP